MTTDNNPNPSNGPSTYPSSPRESTTKPGLPDKKTDQVANRMAHKGAKREQDFDKDNVKMFSK